MLSDLRKRLVKAVDREILRTAAKEVAQEDRADFEALIGEPVSRARAALKSWGINNPVF
jgi:hypothetical protein